MRDNEMSRLAMPSTSTGFFQVEGISDWLLKAGLAANGFLGLVLGFSFMIMTMLTFGPDQGRDAANMVWERAGLYNPEREIPLYILGCANSGFLALGLAFFWKKRLVRQEPDQRCPWAASTTGFAALLSIACLIGFSGYIQLVKYCLESLEPLCCFNILLISLAPQIVVLAILCMKYFSSRMPSTQIDKFSTWDFIMPLGIFLFLYVPDCAQLAGKFFQSEKFHHFDYYFMAPTLAFSHGKSLGTEFFSQYGVGWPMVFTALSPIISISYGHILNFVIIYACLYFCGIYWLLRLLTGSGIWAALGTVLCIFYQMFHGLDIDSNTIWCYPSSTVIRSCMDVWCFICMYLYAVSGRLRWAVAGAVFAALAILFELDTGLYLTITFGMFLLMSQGLKDGAGGRPPQSVFDFGKKCLKVTGVWLGVILIGLAIASRGTLLSNDFWRGWLEAVLHYGSGISSLPLISNPPETIRDFFLVVLLLFGMVSWVVLEYFTSGLKARSLLFGSIALYGLALELLFVNRSHPYNLYHPIIPCCLVGLGFVFLSYEYLQQRWQGALIAMPSLLLIGLSASVCLQPQVQFYPNVINGMIHWTPPANPSPIPDVKLVFAPGDPEMKNLQHVVDWLKSHGGKDTPVAIFDRADTHYFAAGGVCPWYRYSPFFESLLFKTQVQEAGRYLIAHPPAYALIRGERTHPFTLWDFFHKILAENFIRIGAVGDYEIWSSKNVEVLEEKNI